VLIVDETGDRKRGRGIPFAAQQYIGKVGFTANDVVSVTSHWTDGTRHIPLGVTPYWPASRRPEGKKDPTFRTKPELAWDLIEEAWRSGIPFRAVVADCIYGEHPTLTANLFCADIPYVVRVPSGCHSNHGVWQFVEDPANPPAFNPREAAERVPLEQWQRDAMLAVSWNNGQLEGQMNRLKTLKRQMYGRANFELLRQRVLNTS
jgi:SRSO17 transposase